MSDPGGGILFLEAALDTSPPPSKIFAAIFRLRGAERT